MTKTVEDSRSSIDRWQIEIAEGCELTCDVFQDGTLAGLCCLRNITGGNGATDIGYWLSTGFKGRGSPPARCVRPHVLWVGHVESERNPNLRCRRQQQKPRDLAPFHHIRRMQSPSRERTDQIGPLKQLAEMAA
ncbi:GNAT family N-acetyltransferase [Ruegeria jejuensis]|uniref:GNAT family N-acetyltransferase n=1 Tax=Ruegeria jejuensis TaxID=3233338 RepID=UPI00355C5790